jgi:hypothetical protein
MKVIRMNLIVKAGDDGRYGTVCNVGVTAGSNIKIHNYKRHLKVEIDGMKMYFDELEQAEKVFDELTMAAATLAADANRDREQHMEEKA